MLTSFVCNQSMKAFGQPRSILILISLLFVVGLLGYRLELSFPTRAPKLDKTYTPQTKPAPQEVGSYDVLEGAPNNDVNTGLLQAFATNSAAIGSINKQDLHHKSKQIWFNLCYRSMIILQWSPNHPPNTAQSCPWPQFRQSSDRSNSKTSQQTAFKSKPFESRSPCLEKSVQATTIIWRSVVFLCSVWTWSSFPPSTCWSDFSKKEERSQAITRLKALQFSVLWW